MIGERTACATGVLLALSGLGVAAGYATEYCPASGSCYAEIEHISNVAVGDINNTSGCEVYGDFTALSTTMEPGASYVITVTITNPDPSDLNRGGLWVDWNGDGDFDDPGEAIVTELQWAGPGPYSTTITTPTGAAVGDTRMRARLTWFDNPEPCGDTVFGEVEDYTVNIPASWGACCFADGSCAETTPSACEDEGGAYQGDSTDCAATECAVGVVTLDIKPGSCPNPLNRNSRGMLPVALVGAADFDVSSVNVSSVRLARADGVGGMAAPHEGPPGPHSVFEDVATPFDGETCACHDLGGDGIVDLSIKFKTDEVVEALALNDLPDGASVELVVTGALLDGASFEARDCITLVPNEGGAAPARAAMSATHNLGRLLHRRERSY